MMTMKRSAFCLTFVLLAVGLVANCVKIELENLPERCDFRKCTAPDPKRLNVHLIPHSHDVSQSEISPLKSFKVTKGALFNRTSDG